VSKVLPAQFDVLPLEGKRIPGPTAPAGTPCMARQPGRTGRQLSAPQSSGCRFGRTACRGRVTFPQFGRSKFPHPFGRVVRPEVTGRPPFSDGRAVVWVALFGSACSGRLRRCSGISSARPRRGQSAPRGTPLWTYTTSGDTNLAGKRQERLKPVLRLERGKDIGGLSQEAGQASIANREPQPALLLPDARRVDSEVLRDDVGRRFKSFTTRQQIKPLFTPALSTTSWPPTVAPARRRGPTTMQ